MNSFMDLWFGLLCSHQLHVEQWELWSEGPWNLVPRFSFTVQVLDWALSPQTTHCIPYPPWSLFFFLVKLASPFSSLQLFITSKLHPVSSRWPVMLVSMTSEFHVPMYSCYIRVSAFVYIHEHWWCWCWWWCWSWHLLSACLIWGIIWSVSHEW